MAAPGYRDHAISRELIRWESQSATKAESETGHRYQRHQELGTDVVLFARLRNDDRALWCLGVATYIGHEGELSMAIVVPLPGDLYAVFAAVS